MLLVNIADSASVAKSTLELIYVAREAGADAHLLLIGPYAAEQASELASYVTHISTTDVPLSADAITTAIATKRAALGSDVVLMPASKTGLSVSPRVAIREGLGLLEDVTEVTIDGGTVTAKRLTYLSRVTETVSASTPVFVTVKPNVFPAAEASGASANVSTHDVTLLDTDSRVSIGAQHEAATGSVALEEADIVVAGGRGLGDAETFNALIEPLAAKLGAGIGATRAVVDADWRPYSEQIGQTGKAVAPGLYFAFGISGAVQHLSGMNRSKTIVAVNKDADAPIFKIVDYGYVGDATEFIPALLNALDN